MDHILEYGINIFEIYLLFRIGAQWFEKKYKPPTYMVVTLLLSTIILFLAMQSLNELKALYPLIYLCIYLSFYILFRGKTSNKIVVVSIYFILNFIIELLSAALLILTTKCTLDQLYSFSNYRIAGMVISKLSLYVAVKVYLLFQKKKLRLGHHHNLALILFMFLLNVTLIIVTISMMNSMDLSGDIQTGYFLIFSLGIALLYIVSLVLFEMIQQQWEQQNQMELLLKHNKMEQKYVKDTTQLIEQYRRLRHDYIHHIGCMSMLLETHDYDELKQYFQRFQESTQNIGFPLVVTPNKTISALLHHKIQLAQGKNIQTNVDIKIFQEGYSCDLDICTVLGNLLDNAIEACEKINNTEHRMIDIHIQEKEKYLSIVVKNTTDSSYTINHYFQTTKEDSVKHGFGLKSVKQIADQHDGDMDLDCKNGEFIVKIILKI